MIGEISGLINSLFPSSKYNSVCIYQALIDELFRKGMNEFDYKLWDNVLNKKALTSETITKTINEFTLHKNQDVIRTEFNTIATEMGLKTIDRNNQFKALLRYANSSIGSKSTLQLRISTTIKKQIDENISKCNSSIIELIKLVSNSLTKKIKDSYDSQEELTGAILYEYIIRN